MSETNDPDNAQDDSGDTSIQRIENAHPVSAPKSTPQTKPIELATMEGPPLGMRRAADDGTELIDVMAGRASLFGFGFQPHLDALLSASERYLGDATSMESTVATHNDHDALLMQMQKYTAGTSGLEIASMFVCASADLAIEKAIELLRASEPTSRYRTIALRGSDHGRTGVCRTASGRPELHQGYGPMMAGFCHVAAEDIDAMKRSIDDQTVAVLISPIDLQNAARPLSRGYLTKVRELCDAKDLFLIIDESRLCLASAGTPLVYSSIADIEVDGVILSGGIFAGLPGGILLANQRLTPVPIIDTGRYPLITDVAIETFAAIARTNVMQTVAEVMTDFAVQIAECIGHFEFIRDVHATGMTIGIETDIQASELVRTAMTHGLRIEAAGETSIRLQPPLLISGEDQKELMKRIAATMDAFRRDFADLVAS